MVAIIAIIMRVRRNPTRQDPVHQDNATVETSSPAQTESEPVSPWPPVPILGAATAEDLKHYAIRPSAFRSTLEGVFSGPPRERLDDATRRHLNRWGLVGLALLLVAGGAQVLEASIFSKRAGTTSEPAPGRYQTGFQDGPCAEDSPDHGTSCFVVNAGGARYKQR